MGPRAEGELLVAPNGEILAQDYLSMDEPQEGEPGQREAPEAAVPSEQQQDDLAGDLLCQP